MGEADRRPCGPDHPARSAQGGPALAIVIEATRRDADLGREVGEPLRRSASGAASTLFQSGAGRTVSPLASSVTRPCCWPAMEMAAHRQVLRTGTAGRRRPWSADHQSVRVLRVGPGVRTPGPRNDLGAGFADRPPRPWSTGCSNRRRARPPVPYRLLFVGRFGPGGILEVTRQMRNDLVYAAGRVSSGRHAPREAGEPSRRRLGERVGRGRPMTTWYPLKLTYHVRTYAFGERLIPERLGKADVPAGRRRRDLGVQRPRGNDRDDHQRVDSPARRCTS